jgi:hypothetical protein
MQDRREWDEVFKVLIEKNPLEIKKTVSGKSVKNEGEMKLVRCQNRTV